MIYKNKLYAIPDIAKKYKIREVDIYKLIDLGIIPTTDMFETKFLKGNTVLNLYAEIKKFNESMEKGEWPKGSIKIPKGSLMND